MKYLKNIIISALFCPLFLFSRTVIVEGKVSWNKNEVSKTDAQNTKVFLSFKGAKYNSEKKYLPFFSKQLKLNSEKIVGVTIVDLQFEVLNKDSVEQVSGKSFIRNDIDLNFVNGTSKKINYGEIAFTPIIYNDKKNQYQRLISYKIEVSIQSLNKKNNTYSKAFANNSVLSSGDWYKIAVLKDGVYKISYDFLKNLGLDIDNLNPNEFKLYGNGGKMLPALNSAYRPDDLVQNAVQLEDGNDGVFNQGDYVLFYGQSPNSWELNTSTNLYHHTINKYSDSTFYFITFSNTGDVPKRITNQNASATSNLNVTTFNSYDYYEKDNLNLIHSGDTWYGEVFDITTNYDFVFNFPNIDASSPVNIGFYGAARSSQSSSFSLSSGATSTNVALASVNTGSYSDRFAQITNKNFTTTATSDIINVNVVYNKTTNSSIGWLDKIEVNGRRNLIMNGEQLFFRDLNSVGVGNVSSFKISNGTNVNKVWEITNPFNIKEQETELTGSLLSFSLPTDSLRNFVAFTSNYLTQIFSLGKVENQNLHATSQTDMVIVSHPKFLSQATQLAQYHIDNDGLSVKIVTPQQIYNEFSSGSQDVVAIRSFMRMFYENATTPSELPQYLLLFGDGSYDNKDRIVGNSNFIPTYQTPNSIDVIGSLVSDDYFGLLDPSEGTWLQSPGLELLDIAIGRLPVKSTEEANNVIHKILTYNTPNSMKEWRNRITFVGDDEDNNIHMSQSNSLSFHTNSGFSN